MGKNYAVIVAAGRGTRMNAGINKQFIDIKGKPLLYYTLKRFEESEVIDEIVLVLSESDLNYCKDNIISKYHIKKVTHIVIGGSERQHSVYRGLEALKDCDIVLIHDGARPFVSERIINQGIEYAEVYGASASGVKPKDTIKVMDDYGFSKETLDRNKLISIQTPQCFKYDIIYGCHKRIQNEGIDVTDDTMVVERYGHKVFIYPGDYDNIKITTSEDIILAEKIIENTFR